MPKTKKAEAKVEEQIDLSDQYWRMVDAVEGINASIEEINKELFRLTHLLEEQLKKK